ncbi:hypothetical protein F4820DRAFT_462268 [Hypoxylon rubiginosum]|uniref:Uncharacterized protein n=1 Tax=Hypoxylon rubiginosum TaxID=110542 RepID=A0ACB9YK17_9PEZI|nr:hypothetical protein F4820DRAFT_462268 [Hypoxylon rubiginosum]
MKFFEFATEIRLSIYSELLVLDETIDFAADHGPPSPPLFRSKRDGLCPALLRVSKQVHREATPLLYSNNRFWFPQVFSGRTDIAHIAPFLGQIGSRASLIQHICITFPSFDHSRLRTAELQKEHVENLELIRDTCTSIRTLELLVPPDDRSYALGISQIATEATDLLNTRFRTITSLRKVNINFEVYPGEDIDDDVMEKLRGYGWAVTTTKLPKKTWISCDDRVEFDNEEDCIAYDNEQFRLDMKREEERVEELWTEEYDRRRRDPYWKNDSDYD